MKSKTNRLYIIILLFALASFWINVGCGPKRPRYKIGERVVATLDGTATGTVVQIEWGQDARYPEEPYYQVDFGPLTNGAQELTTIWFPGKFLRKSSTSNGSSNSVSAVKFADEIVNKMN